jgi:hypothetical protein
VIAPATKMLAIARLRRRLGSEGDLRARQATTAGGIVIASSGTPKMAPKTESVVRAPTRRNGASNVPSASAVRRVHRSCSKQRIVPGMGASIKDRCRTAHRSILLRIITGDRVRLAPHCGPSRTPDNPRPAEGSHRSKLVTVVDMRVVRVPHRRSGSAALGGMSRSGRLMFCAGVGRSLGAGGDLVGEHLSMAPAECSVPSVGRRWASIR